MGGAGTMTFATGFKHVASLVLQKLGAVADGMLPNFLIPFFQKPEYRSFLENSDIQRNVAETIAETVRDSGDSAFNKELASSIEARWLTSLSVVLPQADLSTATVHETLKAAGRSEERLKVDAKDWERVLLYFAGFVAANEVNHEDNIRVIRAASEELAEHFDHHLLDRLVTNVDQAGFRKVLLNALYDGFEDLLDGQNRLERKFNQALAPTVYLPQATQGSAYAEYVFSRRLTRFAPPSAQLGTLRSFLSEDKFFSWIRVQGAPGSGKSRLLLELCIEARGHGWHAYFIDLSASAGQLDKWEPAEDTLFILDDCLNSSRSNNAAQILTRLTQRASEGTVNKKVRLVLASRLTAGWEEFLTASPEMMVDVPAYHYRESRDDDEEGLAEAMNHALLERALPTGIRLDHWSEEEAQEIAVACLQAFHPLNDEQARYRANEVVRSYRSALLDKPNLRRTGLPLLMLLCAESLAKYEQLGLPFNIQLLSEILDVQRARWQPLRDERLVNLVFLACMLEEFSVAQYNEIYSQVADGLMGLGAVAAGTSVDQLLPHPLSLEHQTLIDLFGDEEKAGKIEPHFVGELFMLSRLSGSFRLVASSSAVAEMSGLLLAAVFGVPSLRASAFRSLCEATIDLAQHEGAPKVNEALRRFRGICDLDTYCELLGAVEDITDEALEELLMEASLALTEASIQADVLESWAFTLLRLVQHGNVEPVLRHIRTPQYLRLTWRDQTPKCLSASAPTAPTALKWWLLLDAGTVHDGWEPRRIENPFILGLHSQDGVHWSQRKNAYVLARSILRITLDPQSDAHAQLATCMRDRAFPAAFRGNEWSVHNLDRILGIYYREHEGNVFVDFEYQGGHQGGAGFDHDSWRGWLVESQPASFYHVRRKDDDHLGGALFNASHAIHLAADGSWLSYLRDRVHYEPAAEEIALAKLLGGPVVAQGLSTRFCRRASKAFKGWNDTHYIDYGSTFNHSFETNSQQYEVASGPLIEALAADPSWLEVGEKWINLDEIAALWVHDEKVTLSLYSNDRVTMEIDQGLELAAELGCREQLEELVRRGKTS